MDSSNNDIQTMWTKGLKLTYKQGEAIKYGATIKNGATIKTWSNYFIYILLITYVCIPYILNK